MNGLCRPVMENLLCTNNVTHTGYQGKTMRSVVFTDTRTPGMNYIWITSAGQEYVEGQYYDISAECDGRGILKRVKLFKDHSKTKSEQPDHESGYKMIIKNRPDALDVLLGEADYSTQVINH